MVHLVAKVGNVYIDTRHAMEEMIVKIIVTNMHQKIQYVVCTLIIALKDVSYSDLCLILQSMLPQLYSTNTASNALQQ